VEHKPYIIGGGTNVLFGDVLDKVVCLQDFYPVCGIYEDDRYSILQDMNSVVVCATLQLLYWGDDLLEIQIMGAI